MVLKKIIRIKDYKSFRDYNVDTLEGNNCVSLDKHKFSFIFAENGCGKSSLCDILKSLYGHKNFANCIPEHVSLEFGDGIIEYKNNEWSDNNFKREDILFFDTDFINENVHKSKTRGTVRGEQEQNSGQLLVDFDKDAIKKKNKYYDIKALYLKLGANSKHQKDKYNSELVRPFNGKNEKIYEFYKSHTSISLEEIKTGRLNMLKELTLRIKNFDENITKTSDVNNISLIGRLEKSDIYVPPKKVIIEKLFLTKILDNILDVPDKEDLIQKIKNHKEFFKSGKEIIDMNGQKICPYCQAKYSDNTIEEILSILEEVIGGERKKAEEDFLQRICKNVEKISSLLKYKDTLFEKVNSMTTYLKQLETDFAIKEISIFKSEDFYKSLSEINIGPIDDLVSHIEQIKDFKVHEFKSEVYLSFISEATKIYLIQNKLDKVISDKNKTISEFKRNFGDEENVQSEKRKLEKVCEKITEELEYLNYRNICCEKKRIFLEYYLGIGDKIVLKFKEKTSTLNDNYKEYCSTEVFNKTVGSMNSYIEYFGLDLKIEMRAVNRSTSEYPFSYVLKDSYNQIRSINDGLSEGEIQILSLSFFFAWLDNHNNINEKVLIFDDPITSMDSGNLHKLSKLILKKGKVFKQVIALTHHSLFFKYLTKSSGEFGGCMKYGILKNKEELGGSFIYYQKPYSNIDELKLVTDDSRNFILGSSEYESNVIRYGQILRYEVENFIKNNILQWHSEKNFSQITTKINDVIEKTSAGELDIQKINEIYSYCNYSNTNHAGYEEITNWEELRGKILEFLNLRETFLPNE